MLQEADYRENLSLKLSEVLDDIGVNDRGVMRMRRLNMMKDTMDTITYKLIGKNVTKYNLGSHSEGTTTAGLHSHTDQLICNHNFNVIQNWSEWEQGKLNLLMIQNENTSPGYCFLQLLRSDDPLPETGIPDENFIDRCGRILLKNTMLHFIQNTIQHGPSLVTEGQYGFCDAYLVRAYPCKSWPQSASAWLERRGIGEWPTQEMKRYSASTSCFVVPTGSKVSVHPDLEWRISTTLAERCLMFDLNITQIRCYVLMKMILKSFLNLQGEINISSFMCKTVLFRSIENTELSIWTENNLFTCLTDCLLELHTCVQNEQCLHFIISENNLMAGQFNAETKHQLSKNLSDFIQSDGQCLLRIDIDDVGHRLHVKMNKVQLRIYTFHSPLQICERNSAIDYVNFATTVALMHMDVLKELSNKNITTIKQTVARLMEYSKTGNKLEHTSCMFIAPFLCSTLGSTLASFNISQNNQVSSEALDWLSAGLTSDNASSRLKLASVIYSAGDMEKTELILRQIERHYHSFPIFPICACFRCPKAIPAEFKRMCNEQNEDCIKHITAFCVKFLQKEKNCVPQELHYEMFRSTQNDMLEPDKDFWMDMAVVDCLPYIYFLQYKTYGHLGRRQDQQQALSMLIRTVENGVNLFHRETALNILGQCMELENQHQIALKCYQLSLQQRASNNAAKIHICRLISGVLAGQ